MKMLTPECSMNPIVTMTSIVLVMIADKESRSIESMICRNIITMSIREHDK